MELFRTKKHPNEPDIATDDHLEERDNEWRKQQEELYSLPAPRWEELEAGKTRGYSSIRWQGKIYLIRQTGFLTETVLLNKQNRREQYWQNWDTPGKNLTRWEYDDEGYVTKIEYMKGSGYGHSIAVSYQRDDYGKCLYQTDGRRKPEELSFQCFFGNPLASWGPRKLVRGENEVLNPDNPSNLYTKHVSILKV